MIRIKKKMYINGYQLYFLQIQISATIYFIEYLLLQYHITCDYFNKLFASKSTVILMT